MSIKNIELFKPFHAKRSSNHININIITKDSFAAWNKTQDNQPQIDEQGFDGAVGKIFITRDKTGKAQEITAGSSPAHTQIDGSKIYDAIIASFSKDALNSTSFSIAGDYERLQIGWGLAAYKFDIYKKPCDDEKTVALVISENSDKLRINTYVESICLIRDLVNIPPNDMTPEGLENAANILAKSHGSSLKVIKDKALIKQNFPMVYDVGKASSCAPRLLDFSWGDKIHPKVTLVGKGVCFDTGGLDIKPSQFMLTMKKDMGGAAHVLALAHMIMSLKLPINLRVLIPAVENSISGNAYRPSDILTSRKGLTVEVGNTDAEGRLVLADALTYACEDKPELLIDFATLTGAARVALGTDIAALFSNNDDMGRNIQDLSASDNVDDAVWQLPLWKPYRKDMDSSVADISSTGVGKAGATTAALFLQEFIDEDTEWIHMDVFAWEANGKSGRPKGGADTGMRAIFAFLEESYS